MRVRESPTVVVLPLTPEVAREYDRASRLSFVGDSRCSLANMQSSCFASELCNGREGGTCDKRLHPLLHEDLAFVALASFQHPPRREYAGCVSASWNPEFQALLVSNLCVDAAFRSNGTGVRLLDAVVRLSRPTCLRVRRNPDPTNTTSSQVFDPRVASLLEYYGRRGFRVCSETPAFYVLRH
jgi:GNAT superfamily N-acetyltransferase